MSTLCRDCKHCLPEAHYRFSELGGHEWVTYHDARCALTDAVTGTGSAGRLCAEERAGCATTGICGSTAQNFEPKPMPVSEPAAKRQWWLWGG